MAETTKKPEDPRRLEAAVTMMVAAISVFEDYDYDTKGVFKYLHQWTLKRNDNRQPPNPPRPGRETMNKRAQAKRFRARKNLPQILAEQDGRCFYCQRPLMVIREIPEELRDEKVGPHIYFRSVDGEYLFALFATIDHVKPLSQNGTNQRTNLVAACQPCNNGRKPK